MTRKEQFSDELLNAYVDGELDAEDRRRIQDAMSRDERLCSRVEALQQLKRLVHDAYVDETPERAPLALPRRWGTGALAASLAAFTLGVALTLGWVSYQGGMSMTRVAAGPDAGQVSGEEAVKVVFHLSRNDTTGLNDILNEAEALLSTINQRERPVFVRVIASGDGLLLLAKESSPQAKRISSLKKSHEANLVFNGCGVAYKQLKNLRADGELELLPEVQLVDLGVMELMRRQRQGWAYIRL